MPLHASFQKHLKLLRWAIVVYFLIAPRVVCHRHVDAMEDTGASQALAYHLNQYHGSDGSPVDDRQLHFHLTFSHLPGLIPSGSLLVIAAAPTGDLGLESLLAPGDCGSALTSMAALEKHERQPSSCCRGSVHACPSGFRRICLGVWTI